ncbi:hypothetical protein [Hydrocoleum sp. CS-953]|uniref:hypothetical protein n=1 Tax=Hydrocoleum sp. CS-953 TaxID=1671698 RepID=UPI00117A43AC|nr:hypothetical protein [Hydrocoleum sp. CS-953]
MVLGFGDQTPTAFFHKSFLIAILSSRVIWYFCMGESTEFCFSEINQYFLNKLKQETDNQSLN